MSNWAQLLQTNKQEHPAPDLRERRQLARDANKKKSFRSSNDCWKELKN